MHAIDLNVSAALPEPDAFGRAIAPSAPRHRAVRQLYDLLTKLPGEAPLGERREALERLSAWLRARGGVPLVSSADPGDRPQVSRLRLLFQALDAFPFLNHALSELLRSILVSSSGLPLLARLGLPTDRGFWAETSDRLSRRFLPEAIDEHDLGQLVAHLFPSERDAIWLSSVPPDLLERVARQLAGSERRGFAPLKRMSLDALALLAARVCAVGLSDVIRVRSPKQDLQSSPFFELPRACDRLIAASRSAGPRELETAGIECHRLIGACRMVTHEVVANLEKFGVSVDVVYRIELITKSLERAEALVSLIAPVSEHELYLDARRFLVTLIQARVRDRDLPEILRANLHLLARKIIERAGQTGEHYITSSRSEYFKMLASAGGGGILTVGTTAAKYLTAWAHFAPFVEGMLSATNYAASFILMQLLGFTLATKQPSMTAAALAGSMRETSGYTDLSGLVTTIARITRSQLAAAIGNIGLVIPAALAFDFAHQSYTGRHFLDLDTANYVIGSLHPTHSGTIFYAALTGVLLWLSSVGAGWIENWAVYRRLPEAIAEHRLRRWFGRRLTNWASRAFARNISGFGGNATLGFLLGMTPVMGKFFGLPLDVRHVTLSTGALTLAVRALGPDGVPTSSIGAAAAGIAIIGSLNFGVSFVLALAVALRARQVERSDRFKLLISVVVTALRSPLQFVLPPGGDAEPAVHGPVSVRPPALSPSKSPPAH